MKGCATRSLSEPTVLLRVTVPLRVLAEWGPRWSLNRKWCSKTGSRSTTRKTEHMVVRLDWRSGLREQRASTRTSAQLATEYCLAPPAEARTSHWITVAFFRSPLVQGSQSRARRSSMKCSSVVDNPTWWRWASQCRALCSEVFLLVCLTRKLDGIWLVCQELAHRRRGVYQHRRLYFNPTRTLRVFCVSACVRTRGQPLLAGREMSSWSVSCREQTLVRGCLLVVHTHWRVRSSLLWSHKAASTFVTMAPRGLTRITAASVLNGCRYPSGTASSTTRV